MEQAPSTNVYRFRLPWLHDKESEIYSFVSTDFVRVRG